MPVTAGEVGAIIRVSTKRQAEQSDSPTNQRHLLANQGATRFYEYVGSGFSLEKRRLSAAWQALIHDIQTGRLHRLLATDISRAARKDELLTELIELCDHHGVEFLASGLQVTHGTAMSWYSAKQMGLMAELYSRDLSDRIKRGQAAAISRGVPAFTSKHLAWHLMREPGTKHGVIPHPERWEDARQAVVDYIEGRTNVEGLSARIYAKHGVMSHSGNMQKWLHSHSLLGHYGKRDGPVLIANCFPALISREESELLQRRLQANRKRCGSTSSHSVYALTGLCRCFHCGLALSHTSTRKPSGSSYLYLKCKNKRDCPGFRKLINAELVETALIYRLGEAFEQIALQSSSRRDQAAESVEMINLRQRVRKLEALASELDTPGVRADLDQATGRLQALEAASSQPQITRMDLDRLLLLRSHNRFMDRPEGERNADLLALIDHCVIDTTTQPEGDDWMGCIVQHIAFR